MPLINGYVITGVAPRSASKDPLRSIPGKNKLDTSLLGITGAVVSTMK